MPSRGLAPACALRKASDVVQASNAQVLSQLSNEHQTAYLLSESSLFVYADHLTMITCGRTRLVNAVARILERVPPDDIALLVYERKNEHFPDRQPSSFYEDAQRLHGWFGGRALRFGDEHDHHVHVFYSEKPYRASVGDTTLEILMHGLSDEVAATFTGCERPEGSTIAEEIGLPKFLPDFEIDEHPFTPAGYSMNGIRGADYYTIHVTPESLGSYVSFETNVDFRDDFSKLVRRVVDVFQPRSFDVVAFTPAGSPTGELELDRSILDRLSDDELRVVDRAMTIIHRAATEGADARRSSASGPAIPNAIGDA